MPQGTGPAASPAAIVSALLAAARGLALLLVAGGTVAPLPGRAGSAASRAAVVSAALTLAVRYAARGEAHAFSADLACEALATRGAAPVRAAVLAVAIGQETAVAILVHLVVADLFCPGVCGRILVIAVAILDRGERGGRDASAARLQGTEAVRVLVLEELCATNRTLLIGLAVAVVVELVALLLCHRCRITWKKARIRIRRSLQVHL